MNIYCVDNDEIIEMLGEGAPLYEVALNCLHLKKTKMVYLLNATTYVWTDLVGFETTYWNGEIAYQELTREGSTFRKGV